MKKLAFVLPCALLLLTFDEANAQTASNFYARVDGGGSFPINTNLAGFENFSPSGMVGAGVGFRILPFLRTDVTGSYRFGYSESATDPSSGVSQTSKIKSLAGFFNAYFDIPTGPLPINPYVGAGIGAARNQVGNTNESDLLGNTITVAGATKTSFAYQAMAGVSFPVFIGVAVDASYHFVDLGRFSTGSAATLDGVPTTVATAGGHLRAHELQLGLRVGF
jgi:opacity protein-like surface antigen